jgi:hypothetical protein
MTIRLRTESDRLWAAEGQHHHWRLPPAAHWFDRLWGIRHLRARVEIYYIDARDRRLAAAGLYPTGYNRWVVYAIRRGWV